MFARRETVAPPLSRLHSPTPAASIITKCTAQVAAGLLRSRLAPDPNFWRGEVVAPALEQRRERIREIEGGSSRRGGCCGGGGGGGWRRQAGRRREREREVDARVYFLVCRFPVSTG